MLKMQHNTVGMSLFTQWALAFQHLLAIFAGTIIVPLATGLPVSITLLFSGISTLIFQFFTRSKIPLFFSSSFTFIGGRMLVKQMGIDHGMTPAMALCYASFGVFVSGLIFIVLGQMVRKVPYAMLQKLAPPVLYGTYIICLGIVMVGDTFSQLSIDPLVATVGILTAFLVLFYSRGTMRLLPIAIAIIFATIVSGAEGNLDLSKVAEVPWIAQPFDRQYMALSIFENFNPSLLRFSILTFMPLVFLSVIEHIANMCAISHTTRVDYIRTIGLPRTFSANGIANMIASLCGAPASTFYTQTTGLIVINKKCSPRLLTMTALLMIAISFCPKAIALFAAIPLAAVGAATFIMCGMVIVVGIRTFVDAKINLSNTRNVLLFSIVTSLTVGIKFILNDSIAISDITLSSLTVAAIVGVTLNIILPSEKVSQDIRIPQ